MNKKKLRIINIIITILFAAIVFYLFLPAINPSTFGFWLYVSSIIGVFSFLELLATMDYRTGRIKEVNKSGYGFIIIPLIFGLIMIINFFLSPVFNAKSFASRIVIDKDSTFTEDISLVDFNSLPLLDKDSSRKVGDRVMGQMPELVSQFYVSDLYTQINYKGSIVRVTPLEYNGFFKYLSNHKNGITGYITVNSVTGASTLTKIEKGMKYMTSAILNEDLDRKLRFSYPTKVFGDKSFELDEDGNPYWIVPTLKYSGIELKTEVEGVVILDPITGKSTYYKVKDVPSWVDHVYSASLIIEQIDDWGNYINGFLNSMFGQKGVVATTEGYNYIVMNDDVYLYTGITSVASDESNLGFTLTNMRTKETKFYAVPGAPESSAMSSAEGQVQQMKYNATFPLLVNLNNKPTYLVSLKDNAGLVKMYAFVDVEDYQKVVVTDASEGIEQAAKNYLGNDVSVDENNLTKKQITVASFTTAIISGNTYYYITDTDNQRYMISVTTSKKLLPFITIGTKMTVSYSTVNDVIDVKKVSFEE